MKCNLDCDYCSTGLYGGHDNSTKHPPYQQCLQALDFMFEYVDLYMQIKTQGIKYVILNVYGGESLHHPDIVEILSQVRQRYMPYADSWHLTVTTTTNAIISNKKLQRIIPFIDEFTVSYHAQNTVKHHAQFRENLLTIAKSGKRQKCIVMMDPTHFQDCDNIITWLTKNNIRYLPKQLDSPKNYSTSEIQWFDKFYKSKIFGLATDLLDNLKKESQLSEVGRACCGGRNFCVDQQHKQRLVYVENKFPDWYCSVNHFFLYVKQVNGEVFVNKDCKMNFDGEVGPIGNLSNTQQILSTLRGQLDTDSLPVIQCKKYNCLCGLCAPKAKDLLTYHSIMEKYHI
jgi:organic radical activating enzyme